MKKYLKSCLSLLLAVTVLCSLSVTAFAAQSSVTFENGKVIAMAPGSIYTNTDLFDNFKGVMPGDVRTEQITVSNQASDYDYIKVYLKAIPHDENNNPISSKVLEELKADVRRGAMSELAYMVDFLKQLTLTVKQGDKVLFEDRANVTGGLTENVYLGTLSKGESLNLDVLLNVPIEMGNEYMNRIGEVDWVFTVEAYENYQPPYIPIEPEDDDVDLTVVKKWLDNGKSRPTSVKVSLYDGAKLVDTIILGDWNDWTYTWEDLDEDGRWQIVEEQIPDGYAPSYSYRDGVITITNVESLIKTGQMNWPIPVLGGLGLLLAIYGLFLILKKKKKDNRA